MRDDWLGSAMLRNAVYEKIDRCVPPGAMRSAPPIKTGMTGAGVEREGRRFGRFHSV